MAAATEERVSESGREPSYDPEWELRLAVVMYGGVSLAIYMYGVADELHRLVKSTAPEAAGATRLRRPSSTEVVYREVARLLGAAGEQPSGHDPAAPPAVRFVVDIIAGTSAGGINGICLAKALANDSGLDGLRDIWLHEADIGRLVADERSARDESGPLFEYVPPPASLLSGSRMQRRLVDALASMERENPDERSRLVDELDLWVTSTDLEGLPVTLRLANGTAYEARYANRFRFRYSPAERDDFQPDANDFLAYAARSTSAFPFAFDPATLERFRPEKMSAAAWEEAKQGWRRFHPDYRDDAQGPFAARFFSDGGILDNKPFSSATDTLVGRRAELPVRRKLIYVEPDPSAGPDRETRSAWNVIDTAQAATLRIPQFETIREDLERVQQRSRDIERMRDVVAGLGLGAERRQLEGVSTSEPTEAWGERTLDELAGDRQWGPAYGVYHQLKVRAVVDWRAALFVQREGFNLQSDQALAVHQLARAYKDIAYGKADEDGPERSAQFLLDFDLPYRLRRIDFVLQKLKELTGSDPELRGRAAAVARLSSPLPSAGEVRELRIQLVDLRDQLAGVELTLGQAIGKLGITNEDLESILDLPGDKAMAARARDLVEQQIEGFRLAAETTRSAVETACKESREQVDAVLGAMRAEPGPAQDLRDALRFYFDAFEAYDLALFPLGFATSLAETNPVEIVRISPRDTDPLLPHARGRTALKGASLHHFGAFLDQGWREHDMVWGRLDAAECLIGSLLGRDHPRKSELIRSAHETILAEYAESKEAGDVEPIDWFPSQQVREEPDRAATGDVLTRAQAVVASMLREIVRQRGGKPGTVLPAIIDTTLGAGPRGAAVSALLRTPIGLKLGGAAALTLTAGLVLLLATGAPDWVGAALVAAGVTLALTGLIGVTVGLIQARRFVRSASVNAVYPPEREAGRQSG
jgi:patatin-related protein